jgi:hypothetical protein
VTATESELGTSEYYDSTQTQTAGAHCHSNTASRVSKSVNLKTVVFCMGVNLGHSHKRGT